MVVDNKTLVICRAPGCGYPCSSNSARIQHEVTYHRQIAYSLRGKRGEKLHFDSTEERDTERLRIIASLSEDKVLKRDMANEQIFEVVNASKLNPKEFLGLESIKKEHLEIPELELEFELVVEPEPIKKEELEVLVEPEPETPVPESPIEPGPCPVDDVEPEQPVLPAPIIVPELVPEPIVVEKTKSKPKSGFFAIIANIENNLKEDLT